MSARRLMTERIHLGTSLEESLESSGALLHSLSCYPFSSYAIFLQRVFAKARLNQRDCQDRVIKSSTEHRSTPFRTTSIQTTRAREDIL